MTFVSDVLNMAGRAIGLIFCNQYAICSKFNSAIMAGAASCAWRLAIDRIERFVAA